MVCYSSGICSAAFFVSENAEQTSNHCDMINHAEADDSDASQVLIQGADSTDSSDSLCCYEGLTNSSPEDNITNIAQEVLFTLDLPNSLDNRKSKFKDSIITRSTHDPPDIYLSVSRFLL